jgi:hypothetical protein
MRARALFGIRAAPGAICEDHLNFFEPGAKEF